MKKTERIKWVCGLFFLLSLWMAASSAALAAPAVRLNRTKLTMTRGTAEQLELLGDVSGKITWKSSRKSVVTVNAAGRIVAKKKGTATITARVAGRSYRCKVTVRQPVTSIRLNQRSIAISVGRTYTLKATVKPSNANVRTVTWVSSNKKVVTVTAKGKLKAVAPGTAVITAKAKDGSGKQASCKLLVKTPVVEKKEPESNAATGEPGAAGPQSGESALARNFLNILQKYSDRVQSDCAQGTIWRYSNSGAASSWSAALSMIQKKGYTYCNCALLPRWALRELGIIDTKNFWGLAGGGIQFRGNVKEQLLKHCEIIAVYKTPNQLLAEGNLLPGDICTWVEYQHTNVYAGNGLWYDSGRSGAVGGYQNGTFVFRTFGPAATVNMSGTTVGYIIRLVK